MIHPSCNKVCTSLHLGSRQLLQNHSSDSTHILIRQTSWLMMKNKSGKRKAPPGITSAPQPTGNTPAICLKCGVYKPFEHITEECCANNGQKCTFPRPTKKKKPTNNTESTLTVWLAPNGTLTGLARLCDALNEADFPKALQISGGSPVQISSYREQML